MRRVLEGVGASGRGQRLQEAAEARGPAGAALCPQVGQVFGPVMGLRVFGLTIRVVAGGGAEEVEVDCVHGLRPVLDHASYLS